MKIYFRGEAKIEEYQPYSKCTFYENLKWSSIFIFEGFLFPFLFYICGLENFKNPMSGLDFLKNAGQIAPDSF